VDPSNYSILKMPLNQVLIMLILYVIKILLINNQLLKIIQHPRL